MQNSLPALALMIANGMTGNVIEICSEYVSFEFSLHLTMMLRIEWRPHHPGPVSLVLLGGAFVLNALEAYSKHIRNTYSLLPYAPHIDLTWNLSSAHGGYQIAPGTGTG